LLLRFADDVFTDNFMPTIGVDFVSAPSLANRVCRKSEPSRLMARQSSYRFGIPLVRSDSRPSPAATTRELTVSL
jgi:hypothetical protein